MSFHMHFVFSLLPALGMPLLPTVTPNPLQLSSSQAISNWRTGLPVFPATHASKIGSFSWLVWLRLTGRTFELMGPHINLQPQARLFTGVGTFIFITRFVSKNVCQLATEILIIKLKIQLRNTGFIALLSWSRGTLVILLFTNNLKLFINYLDKLSAVEEKMGRRD